MSAKAFTNTEASAANISIIEEGDKGMQAIHDLIVAYRANRRTGSANTKTRGEVRGTKKKMYRQKGTGNARHGAKTAPIFVGGGVVFGPKPRDYSKKVTKKTRKLAFQRALGGRISEGVVLSVGSFAAKEAKTSAFISEIQKISDKPKVLVIASSYDENTYLAARNVQWALLQTAKEVNVEQILHYDQIIIVEDAFETLAQRSAS